ncbi:MAG: molybdopterin-binding protein [Thermodesulfovibrionales bacterium]
MKDMLGRDKVITAQDALEILLKYLPATEPSATAVPLEDALTRVCAKDIVSDEDLPSFGRSTVDGYAVRAESTFGAKETMPAYIAVSGEVLMGEMPGFSLSPNSCAKIPTGGMLPEGADAVVMFEHAQTVDAGMIEVLSPVAPGENVIHPGEDVRSGGLVVARGRRLRPQDVGACAGIGNESILVYDRPLVSIISTGDEIVPASSSPGPGQVRDINSYVIAGMVAAAGGIARREGIFADDYEAIRAAVEKALADSSAIVLSGGTSVGTKDMVARIIDDIGNPGVLFHGLSLKPGKPMIGGVMRGVPVFGLPGHPAAVAVCFDLLIRPVLARLSGESEASARHRERIVAARLSRNLSSAPGREEHVRVMLEERPDGFWAVPVMGKSGLITTLVKADGVVVIPLNSNGIAQGEEVSVRLFG